MDIVREERLSMHIQDGFFLHLLRLLLLPSGIIIYPQFSKFRIPYVISVTIFLSTGLCGIVIALFISNSSKIQLMETLYALNIGLNVLEFFWVQQFLRKGLYDLYIDIERHYLQNDNFVKLSDTMSREFASTVLRVALCLYIVMNIPPILLVTVAGVHIADMRALSFPIWCPWRIDNIWKYMLTMGIEVTGTAIASLILYSGMGVIYCYIIAIRCHCEIFRIEVAACLKSDAYSSNMMDEFRGIIIKHQHLMRFTAKIISVSSYIVKMVTLVFFISVIMLTTILLKAPNDYLYALKLIAASANLFIIFFGCCYIGEELRDLNYRIQEQIYETQWYEQNIHIKKMLILFMLQNKKSFELKVFKLFAISLNFFVNVVKKCYSIIQVLTAYSIYY